MTMRRRVAWLLLASIVSCSASGVHIVFGSCNKQSEKQPFWDVIADLSPDKLLMMGDNIYADIRDFSKIYKIFSKHSIFLPATPGHLKEQYQLLAEHSGFQRAVQTVGWQNILATYDDHDFGLNDGDKLYEYREESRQTFLDFWKEPKHSPVWQRDGVYKSHSERTADGHVIKYIILDARYNKDPYGTKHGDFLGEPQWKWLEAELQDAEPDVVLIVSSIQVLGDDKMLGEYWGKFPKARARLLQLITSSPVPNTFILSGDVHYAEVSEARCGARNLLDITSSGMTHAWKEGGTTRGSGYQIFQSIFPARYRRHRYDDQFGGLNIGELKISFDDRIREAEDTSSIGKMTIRILNSQGESVIERDVNLRPKGYFTDKQVTECEPYWGPTPFYQKMAVWLFLGTMLIVFGIIPLLTFIWLVLAAFLYVMINMENQRRQKVEQERKKRN